MISQLIKHVPLSKLYHLLELSLIQYDAVISRCKELFMDIINYCVFALIRIEELSSL